VLAVFSSKRIATRLVQFSTGRPRRAILSILAAVALLTVPAVRVGLDNDFSKLYSTATEADSFRLQFREIFGANDGLLVAVLTPERPDDPAFLDLLSALADESARDPDVARVFSVANTSLPVDTGGEVVFSPVFGPKSLLNEDHAHRLDRALSSPLLERLLSNDGTRFVLAAELEEELRSFEGIVHPAERFRDRIRDAVQSSPLNVEVLHGGIPETRIYATEALEGDLFYLAPFVTLVLAVLLFGFFRRSMGVSVTLVAIGLSTIATAGVVGLAGDDFNFLTVLYPVFLATITTAHCVHLLHQYRHERLQGNPRDLAARNASIRVTAASFLTSLTTAIGFGSLIAARAMVLRTFGFYLAIGIIISFVVVSMLVPASLVLLGDRMVSISTPSGNTRSRMTKIFDALTVAITGARGAPWVTVLGVVALVALFWSARDVEIDYILSNHAQRGSEIYAGNQVIDRELGGVVPIEVSFLGKPGDFREPKNLVLMERSARWLSENYDVPTPVGLSTVIKEVSRSFGAPYEVPASRELLAQLMLVAESSPDEIVPQLVTDDRSHARLRTAAVDRGANYIVSMHREFDEFAGTLFAGTGIRARMTGDMVVGYDGMNRLSRELVRSVSIALVLVLLVIGLAFGSFRIAAVSVLPNVLPVAVGLALLKATGSVINPMPGIVFCLGIGLSVDDTIHLIARQQEEVRSGKSLREAALEAVRQTRGALVATTVVLSVGLSLLALSTSDLNQTMSWLAGTVMITALAADLLITPAMLSLLGSAGSLTPGTLEAETEERSPPIASEIREILDGSPAATPEEKARAAGDSS
jgi:predicted RND superfamily exporter protein